MWRQQTRKNSQTFLFPTYLRVLLPKEYQVTSVTRAQILNNPWVWYNHNILPMIKMSNRNITQRGTQTTGVGIMIGRCSPDSQHEGNACRPANVGSSSFRYTNDDLTNHTNQRHQHRKWTWEDNKFAPHCYFRSNPTQRWFRKRMIENALDFRQRANQVRTMIKTKLGR